MSKRLYSLNEILSAMPNGDRLVSLNNSIRWSNGKTYLQYYYDTVISSYADMVNGQLVVPDELIEDANWEAVRAVVKNALNASPDTLKRFFTNPNEGASVANEWLNIVIPLGGNEDAVVDYVWQKLASGALQWKTVLLLAASAAVLYWFLRKR